MALVIYGSLDTVSGGYLYDRKLVAQLRACGHTVEIVARPWRTYARHLADNLSPAWRRRLRTLAVDLLLEDELNHPSLAFAPRPPRVPVVTLVHHLRSSEEHPRWARPLYRAVEARYLRRADALICNSQTTVATVARLRPVLPPTLVAYPAGDHVLSPGFLSLHESARRSDAPLHVAFVGNLIARKNLHALIDALARCESTIRLSIAGSETADPAYAARVRAQVRAAGLSARVAFLGPIDDAARAQLYAACDLLAAPSYEGFGITYLEAMAFGKPVIASTSGAAHELVTNGVNGYLIRPDDVAALAVRLSTLARDPALYARMAAAATATFAAWPTWAQTTARSVAFLEELWA